MSKVPSLDFHRILAALQRAGWIMVRQKGSHIRLRKDFAGERVNITVPAHRPVKRSTLAHILKQARLTTQEFLDLV